MPTVNLMAAAEQLECLFFLFVHIITTEARLRTYVLTSKGKKKASGHAAMLCQASSLWYLSVNSGYSWTGHYVLNLRWSVVWFFMDWFMFMQGLSVECMLLHSSFLGLKGIWPLQSVLQSSKNNAEEKQTIQWIITMQLLYRVYDDASERQPKWPGLHECNFNITARLIHLFSLNYNESEGIYMMGEDWGGEWTESRSDALSG